MKRRFKSNIKYPLTTTRGDIAPNRGFEKPSDMRKAKAKKVRFDDTEMEGAPVHASSRGREATESPKCGAPKTSEYAYFKKFKNGAVRGHSRALHEENEQLKSSKINYLIRETSSACDKLNPGSKDLNFSVSGDRAEPSEHDIFLLPRASKYDESDQIGNKELTNQIRKRPSLLSENVTPVGQSLFLSPVNEASEKSDTNSASDKLKRRTKGLNVSVSGESARPSDHILFLSPRVCKYDESDHIRNKELTNKNKKRSLLLSENATPVGQGLFSSTLNEASEKTENQCSEKGIFFAKRLRLRQWVAHTSFPEVEKLHPKGFDLVSLLLSRLLPKGYENNDSSKGDINDSTKRLTFHESHNPENRFHLSHRRDWDKDLPEIGSGRPTDIVLAEWDRFVSGFPSNYHKESHFQDESIETDQHSKSSIYRSINTQHGFPFCLPFHNYRSSGSFHFKDLDGFGSITERGRKPYRLLLEWDSELGEDRFNSSIVNHDIEKNVYSRLANSWNVDPRRNMDNVLDPNMCPSSLFSNYFLEFNALPNYSSNGCLMHDFGPNFDDVKCAVGEPGQFPLALPCTPTCIPLAEDKNGENIHSNSNIIFSYSDQDWLKKQVWDGNPLSKIRWKCLSAPDYSAEDYPSVCRGWNFPENENSLYSLSRLKVAPTEEPFTPLYAGAFNRYFLSPMLQSSIDTFMNCPLLLDHVSQDSPDEELYFDDYGSKLGYRKLL